MVVEGRAPSGGGAASGVELLVDTGDDTAAWRAGGATELFTTDTVVEGIHFTRDTTPWRDLGWKSLASNISDIAAMGGLPVACAGYPGSTPRYRELDDLQRAVSGHAGGRQ